MEVLKRSVCVSLMSRKKSTSNKVSSVVSTKVDQRMTTDKTNKDSCSYDVIHWYIFTPPKLCTPPDYHIYRGSEMERDIVTGNWELKR